MLAKYAPPYNRTPVYSIADTCLVPIFVTPAVLYKSRCDGDAYTAYNAHDGSVIGSAKIPNSVVRNGGSDNGGADSYGNFFIYAVNKGTASVVEYAPPTSIHKFDPSHITTPVLFTGGGATLYASAQDGLNVYHSVGRGVTPRYKYLIKERLLPGVGSEGRYAVAGTGVLFAAPFQKVTGCPSLVTSWTISVFSPDSTAPFEKISPPKGSACIGGGVDLIAADSSADLFVVNQSLQLLYYPFGSKAPAWSKQLHSDPANSLAAF